MGTVNGTIAIKKVPSGELAARMSRFVRAMDARHREWELCAITGSVNIFYFTGTIQNGTLLIDRKRGATYWVRKSPERAAIESEFPDIKPLQSFGEVAGHYWPLPETLYLDASEATMQWYSYIAKYMPFKKTVSADAVISKTRSVKSAFEADKMREAGRASDRLMRESVPRLFRSGMSEAELAVDIYSLFVKNGHHGVCRFSTKVVETVPGHIGFSESSLYPSALNGASGLIGLCPAAPVLGSRDVRLKDGDLIYVDIVFGIDGYNVDKTFIYSFNGRPRPHISEIHSHCLELERLAASMLRPGTAPSEIYRAVVESVRRDLRGCFMGPEGKTVPFVGHGIGLHVDEWPALAEGFDEPLEHGMAIAVEPKMGVAGAGIVGSENTYLVGASCAECITGGGSEIILA